MDIQMPCMLVNPFNYFRVQSLSLFKNQDYFFINKKDLNGEVVKMLFVPVILPDHSNESLESAVEEMKDCDELHDGDSVLMFHLVDVVDRNTVFGHTIPEHQPIRFHIPFSVLVAE